MRAFGKSTANANQAGGKLKSWRYRLFDYRMVDHIRGVERTVTVLRIAYRTDIYRQRAGSRSHLGRVEHIPLPLNVCNSISSHRQADVAYSKSCGRGASGFSRSSAQISRNNCWFTASLLWNANPA